ncbi:GAF and ANTAR domain-containing protein [Oerskovia sp. NPDC060338]|uniref:GAF and ANTAR domain-containing protein n=1 Tax=Oerskovia sp. NPDC060338 TaxID=3347100 RepID=UPI00365712DA
MQDWKEQNRTGSGCDMDGKAVMLGLLARSLARGDTSAPLAVRLCRACVEILEADGGALTLSSTTPERLTVSTSNGNSARFEDLQEVLGEGPGQVAYTEGRTVIEVVDGSDSARFPVFSDLAEGITGPVTLFAVPMRPAGQTLGVLTLYTVRGPLAHGIEDAQFLADAVGAALLGDPDSVDALAFPTWPERARVHQATGMIVAQLGVAPEDALALLRATAYAESQTLDQVAEVVISGRLNFARHDDLTDGIVSHETPGNEET